MVRYNITSEEQASTPYSHINGATENLLARFAITELCKGWPVYRDASEWRNYRDLLVRSKKTKFVYEARSGGFSIHDFIAVSALLRDRGDFIMHRENGTLSEINLSTGRGLGKMKATITQRFDIDYTIIDVECDCRFIFFCINVNQEWKVQYVKLFYEKDKVVAVDGKTAPDFRKEVMGKYPEGYRYLAAAQVSVGHKVLNGLPTSNNKGFEKLNAAMEDWMAGKDVDMFWESDKGEAFGGEGEMVNGRET